MAIGPLEAENFKLKKALAGLIPWAGMSPAGANWATPEAKAKNIAMFKEAFKEACSCFPADFRCYRQAESTDAQVLAAIKQKFDEKLWFIHESLIRRLELLFENYHIAQVGQEELEHLVRDIAKVSVDPLKTRIEVVLANLPTFNYTPQVDEDAETAAARTMVYDWAYRTGVSAGKLTPEFMELTSSLLLDFEKTMASKQ